MDFLNKSFEDKKIIDMRRPILVSMESFTMMKDFDVVNDDGSVIKATLQIVDEISRNDCYYSADDLLASIRDSRFVQENINNKTWFGEEEHPPRNSDYARLMLIDKNEISHRIDKYWLEDDRIMGIVQWATPRGPNIQRTLMEHGSNFGFSLRAHTPNYIKRQKADGTPYIEKKYPMNVVTYDFIRGMTGHRKARLIDPDKFKAMNVDSGSKSPRTTISYEGGGYDIIFENPADQIRDLMVSGESADILYDIFGVDITSSNIQLLDGDRVSVESGGQSLNVPLHSLVMSKIIK